MRRTLRLRSLAGLAALAVCWLAAGASAGAQSLAEIDRAEAALDEAWAASPIAFRTVAFTSAPPTGFGLFEPRADAVFSPGEPLVVYAEPVGYGYTPTSDGRWRFGFDVDLLIKTAGGKIIGGQEGFERLALASRARNREFMVTLTLELDGAPPGDYVLVYTLRDITGDKSGELTLPFSIAER